jgi:hypothetical protein
LRRLPAHAGPTGRTASDRRSPRCPSLRAVPRLLSRRPSSSSRATYKRPVTPLTRRTLLGRAEPLRRRPWPAASNSPLRPFPVAGPLPNLLPRPRESFPSRPFLCPGRDLAGVGGTAANTGRRRRVTPPAPPPLQTPAEIEPRDPSSRPPPVPGRSRRRFAGIWPDRRRPVLGDYIAKSRVFLRT